MLWITKQHHESQAVKLHVEEEKIILNDSEYTLDKFMGRSDFRPFSRYIIPLKQTNVPRTIQDEKGGSHSYPYTFRIFDAFAMTNISKVTPGEMSEMSFHHVCTAVSFIFYPNTKNFKDALCIVGRAHEQYTPFEVTTTVDGKIVPYDPDEVFPVDMPKNHFVPKCELTGPATVTAKGTKINFRYKDIAGNVVEVPDFKASTKSDKGYISHSKFEVNGGKGSFSFYPMGLAKGEIATIKVGIGKYTDVASINLTVE